VGATFAALGGDWIGGAPRACFVVGILAGTAVLGIAANVWAVMTDTKLSTILALGGIALLAGGAAVGAGSDSIFWVGYWAHSIPAAGLAGVVGGGFLGVVSGAVLGAVYQGDTEWWVGTWPAS
jgi:hypothetical protein